MNRTRKSIEIIKSIIAESAIEHGFELEWGIRTRTTLFILLFLSLAIVIGNIYVSSIRVKQDEIEEYVINNQERLDDFARKLYEGQDNEISTYHKVSELQISKDSLSIFDRLQLERIVVYKDCYDSEDCIKVYLKNKPRSSDYYTCGIYYSPKKITLDFYGNIQPDDDYMYDGTPNGTRVRYRSEKICDYWYYFEEAVWN